MGEKELKLFTNFKPVPTEKWEEVITADLKGADYSKKLVWKTAEGFDVRPYYRSEDLEEVKHLGSQPGEFPFVRGAKAANNWRIHETIEVNGDCAAANAKALKAIAAGCDSIGFCISVEEISEADFAKMIAGIDFAAVETLFCGCGAHSAAKRMIAYAKDVKMNIDDACSAFVIDPIVRKLGINGKFGCCEDGSKCMGKIAELVNEAGEYKRFRFVSVSGHLFHNSGSTIVQELAFTLAAGHEYIVKLMEAGLDINQASSTLRFSMAVSSNYFMEIAKFRAARMLWANIAAPYKPSRGCASRMRIHAITSEWNMTAYDSYTNMLRGTTEAMSAALAGVHSLEVLPFNKAYESPTEFSARIARNVQLLLKHEAHFDQVVDPAGGSYYIERLTQSIAEEAWKLFLEVEAKGGYIEAFKAGFIQDAVEASAAKKALNVATRREILIGTNQYPNFTESFDSGDNNRCSCNCGDEGEYRKLKPFRGAEAFEELRMKVDASGREPNAFMLTCGTLAMARARAQFACNFFACAGIRPIDNTFFTSVEDGVKSALASNAEIVVICASDNDYAVLAPEAAKLLDGKAIFVVAGAPACRPELEATGISRYINIKSNLLETLKEYVKELGI